MRPPFEVIKDKKDLVGVEVGVHRGYNALNILKGLSLKKLYLVDPWVDYVSDLGHKMVGLAGAERSARKTLARYSDRLVWLKGTSANVVGNFEDNFLDFVYIDGDHSYKHVLHDVTAWTPKVKKGGMVSGHDYTSREGVKKAVDEYCSKNKVELIRSEVGSHWWFIR